MHGKMLRQTIYTAPLSALNVIKTFDYALWLYIGDVGSCSIGKQQSYYLRRKRGSERERGRLRARITNALAFTIYPHG